MLEKEMEELKGQEQTMLEQRNALSYKIKVKDMPEQSRYNRLHLESKHVQNIIKMICYRAETSFANLLSPYYSRSMDEKRIIAKRIIKTNINLIPNYQNNTLTLELYSLSTPRENIAAKEMCNILNKQNAIYPGTKLKLCYKMAT